MLHIFSLFAFQVLFSLFCVCVWGGVGIWYHTGVLIVRTINHNNPFFYDSWLWQHAWKCLFYPPKHQNYSPLFYLIYKFHLLQLNVKLIRIYFCVRHGRGSDINSLPQLVGHFPQHHLWTIQPFPNDWKWNLYHIQKQNKCTYVSLGLFSYSIICLPIPELIQLQLL